MSGHYFDRADLHDSRPVCEPCGATRWGDPAERSDAAFDNRYFDKSGDWCWAPWLAGDLPCRDCGTVLP